MSLIIASWSAISVKMDVVFQLLGATDVSATKDSSWISEESVLTLMNVRKTPVLVENVLTTRAPTPASAELAIRARSHGQSAETLTNAYRMAGSAVTVVASTRMVASTVCVMPAFTSHEMGGTVKTWMNAAYGTCALMECASMKMVALSVFANLDSSWPQMGVIAKILMSVKHLGFA